MESAKGRGLWRFLWAVSVFLSLALGQVFPQGGGRYLYSDGTQQELLPTQEGYRLRYWKEGRVFREDRLKGGAEGLFLLGVGLPEGYFPFTPPPSSLSLEAGPGAFLGGKRPVSRAAGGPFRPGGGNRRGKGKGRGLQRLPGAGGLHHGEGRHGPKGALLGPGPGGGGLPHARRVGGASRASGRR